MTQLCLIAARRHRCTVFWLLASAACLPVARGQDVWTAAPYRVHVWLALQSVPEVEAWKARIPTVIARQTEAAFGSAWQLEVMTAADSMSQALAVDLSWPSYDTLSATGEDALDCDKLFLVGVSRRIQGFQVQVRELDCRTRAWRSVLSTEVRQTGRLADAVAELIIESFTPIGLIGRSKEGTVDVAMRAGLLTGGAKKSLIIPPSGSIMRGVVRRLDRLGKIVPNGVEDIPWTLLQVAADEVGNAQCTVISGLRSPFRARSSRQVERIAMLVRPELAATRLRLHEKGNPENSLSGYDVYFRLPNEKTTTLIGRTDWQGQIEVKRDEDPIKILYVKNGGRLLARLPMVPGFQPHVEAELVDDSRRLESEGFLKGIQEQMVEITVRNRVLALRIRRAIVDKRIDKAEQLLEEMRRLETREDLERKMRSRQSSLRSTNRAIQDRIDRMFRDTRSMLQKYLATSEVDALQNELQQAR